MLSHPCLAAITLDAKGGGVATVSRLLWRVFEDRWPGGASLVTLLDDEAARCSLDSSTATRLRFGAHMASTQAIRTCDWILYAHLAVSKVQIFIPPPIRRPYAVFLHGIEAWGELSGPEQWVLKGAALRLANSRFTAERVAARHPEIGPISACPLALADDPIEPCPDDESGSMVLGPHAVMVVARMSASERYKGHDELLEAWPRVLVRVPDARLVCVGGGDDVERLQAKAEALGIAGACRFTGFLSQADLLACYRQAAVFAMPSRGEGFGLVYLEAMAHGLPCVGSLEDAAVDIIADGVTGFLVDQSDGGALADRLSRLLKDDNRRRAMGDAGRRRVDELFTYERFSRRLMALLDATLPGPAPALRRRSVP